MFESIYMPNWFMPHVGFNNIQNNINMIRFEQQLASVYAT